MKVNAATTLLFATLAIASPAAIAQPNADAAAVAQPLEVEPRAPAPILEARKKKPKGGSSGNSTGAATSITPSFVLSLGAAGVGAIEIVRLWG